MVRKITRIKKTNTIVPNSIIEANALLKKLSKTQNAINAIETQLRENIVHLKKIAKEQLKSLTAEQNLVVNALFTFAQARKEELTREQRTVYLKSGVFGWRMTPPRVELDYSEEDTIGVLKYTNNHEFIRTKEEVDREALLEKKPSIEGISYEQNDEFFVVPKQEIKKPKTITRTIDRI